MYLMHKNRSKNNLARYHSTFDSVSVSVWQESLVTVLISSYK